MFKRTLDKLARAVRNSYRPAKKIGEENDQTHFNSQQSDKKNRIDEQKSYEKLGLSI